MAVIDSRINTADELELLKKRAEISKLKILNADEASIYLGLAKSYLYKLTMAGILPFSKPNNKVIYFEREKLDSWMLSNASTSQQEKETAAANYVSTVGVAV